MEPNLWMLPAAKRALRSGDDEPPALDKKPSLRSVGHFDSTAAARCQSGHYATEKGKDAVGPYEAGQWVYSLTPAELVGHGMDRRRTA